MRLAFLALVLGGCLFGQGSNKSQGGRAAPADSSGARDDEVASPTDSKGMLAFLADGHYTSFPHDAKVRKPLGPHGVGGIRVFYQQKLFDSLHAKAGDHPQGSAAIAELYAADGTTRIGWAAAVKLTKDSEGGFGWLWLEALDGMPPKLVDAGNGLGQCTGCHSAGDDYVLGPMP